MTAEFYPLTYYRCTACDRVMCGGPAAPCCPYDGAPLGPATRDDYDAVHAPAGQGRLL